MSGYLFMHDVMRRLCRYGGIALVRAGGFGAPGRTAVVLLAVALALPAWAPARPAAVETYTLSGTVVHVADGDTVTLLMGRQKRRIRLASIDAPEIGHGRQRPGQPYSQASRKALAQWVAGKTLDLLCYERDQYGRDVCDIPLGGGDTVSRRLVAAGMAWANEQGGGKYMRDPELRRLEREARRAHRGLWQHPDAVAPWAWRWSCWDRGKRPNPRRDRRVDRRHSTTVPICR